jgi:Flp pilus assembly protein TadD
MPTVQERTVPHGTFTDHWIRVVAKESTRPIVRREREGGPPIEPFYDRDRTGPEAPIYQAMGGIVYATLANDGRALGDAAGALDRALGTSPGRPQARFLLGVAYQQLGATEEAIRALEQSVRADSSNPETLRALAQAYDRAGRDPAAIERLYRRALALQPALAWIRAEYAGFLEAHGLVDQALGEYHAALDEQPSLAVAWFDLGTTLAGQRRLAESSKAFAEAVHLDPQLGQAMSSLVEVRTSGTSVTEVSSLGSPLSSLPVRDRGPRAARLTVTAAPASGAVFENVPPNATVQVLRPDGTVVRTLSVGPRSVVSWDLRLDSGAPLGGGLYRVRVLARDPAGQPMPPQQFYIGVVRQRSA